jgi:hypothetical protein
VRIYFCHVRIWKIGYHIENGILFNYLSTMAGTASRIRSSTSGKYFKHVGRRSPAFLNRSTGNSKQFRTKKIVELNIIFVHSTVDPGEIRISKLWTRQRSKSMVQLRNQRIAGKDHEFMTALGISRDLIEYKGRSDSSESPLRPLYANLRSALALSTSLTSAIFGTFIQKWAQDMADARRWVSSNAERMWVVVKFTTQCQKQKK